MSQKKLNLSFQYLLYCLNTLNTLFSNSEVLLCYKEGDKNCKFLQLETLQSRSERSLVRSSSMYLKLPGQRQEEQSYTTIDLALQPA